MVKLSMNDISTLEIIVIILFILFLIFQVSLPAPLVKILHSNLGMAIILCIVVYLFLYTNPILGILSIFVVYELIRRSRVFSNLSSNGHFTPNPMIIKTHPTYSESGYKDVYDEDDDIQSKTVHFSDMNNIINPTKTNICTDNAIHDISVLEYTPDEKTRMADMERMSPEPNDTLEIDMVNTMAPMGQMNSSCEYVETSFKPVMDNTKNSSFSYY